MHFDDPTDRRGIHSAKWDLLEPAFGIPADEGLPMWVADKDFYPPDFLQDAARQLVENGNYGYFTGEDTYKDAVAWWMKTRHGWDADPAHMFTTFGLGHAIATSLQCFSEPGDHVAIFTPVYHEFANKINKTGRVVTELPLVRGGDGVYAMDFDAYDALMTGREKVLLISSPHNPAGRVWTATELTAMADFCIRHDLLLISDEIHQDLVFQGHKHLPMPVAAPQVIDRLVMTTAASKTFSIAGARTGCVTIPDEALRTRFAAFFRGFDISPNILGITLSRAAYSAQGADYVDQMMPYLEENARVFKEGVDAIPGLWAMPMQGTYLAWVDFAGTGMGRQDFTDRVYKKARIAATPGHTL